MGVPYDVQAIERKWRERWAADRLYEVDVEHADAADVFYSCVEFPYPSGDGLHVGHVFKYGGADVLSRIRRMQGKVVFQPIGWDSFGINAENYALKVGEPPAEVIGRTIARFKAQLQSVGIGYDWSRELATSDPGYYRWTQWVFLRLHEAGLAYRAEAPVTWCPSCRTVLAREQLEGDRCERCDTVVGQRVLRQWYLRMTSYAQRLLDGLDGLDWTRRGKRLQSEWIGRSEGTEIDFRVHDDGDDRTITVFTTRPDTLPAVTFLALSPDFDGAVDLATDDRRADVEAYVTEARRRQAAGDRVPRGDGVDTGRAVVHPVTGERLPVVVADYVLGGYGTGAVMGVPAHDERDGRLASVMELPVSDAPLDPSAADGLGRPAVRFRLRDWLVSRQRYWGPPIPIVHCESCGEVPVPDDQLPVTLPPVTSVEQTRPAGEAPLAAFDDWVATTCPSCGGAASRETDVLDTFVDSSWYFLRYPSTDVDDRPWDDERTARMLPIDFYAGGIEHSVRHHLYARFVCMALSDLGLLPFEEPFPTIRLGGMIVQGGAKMSKSKGNVVEPDDYVATVGADVLRCALFFVGPWDQGGDFSDDAVPGIERWLTKLWRAVTCTTSAGPDGDVDMDRAPLAHAVTRVTDAVERMAHNVGIASLMEVTSWLTAALPSMSEDEAAEARSIVVRLLAPFAPHLAEELWQMLGGEHSVHTQPWPRPPVVDVADEVEVVVQVDGKVRGRVTVSGDADVVAAALADEKVAAAVADRAVARTVVVPGRLVNVVTA